MDKETIKRLDALRSELSDANRRLGWMSEWERYLYREKEPEDVFFVTIQRRDNSKCVFQGEMGFEEVDKLFREQLARYTAERDSIEKEIEDL